MSITFGCPECMVQIEVADEHAGESGECPRCKRMIVIPSPHKPTPVLIGAKAVPMPTADPWNKPAEKPRRAESASPRRARPPATPKQPAGPIWPWVVGVFMALVVAGLLFSSFVVLVAWRRPEPTRQPLAADVVVNKKGFVPNGLIGRMEGERAFMQDGVFQIQSELTINDGRDPWDGNRRCKRFEITLRRGQVYLIEQTSNQFDCLVRVEDFNGGHLKVIGNVGIRNVSMEFHAPHDGIFVVYATCAQPGFGNFNLTIRERNWPDKF